ncbi:proline dehydrogenase [Meiothermus sp. QL-1]|uniref:proline dehydrogenase n=1 Tax=Meiothermus sp. QL-1 TaxID=2058095 RepID=UPI000E0AEC8E|nr:proline dehydrogenase family protein [Meiothermus sp. QL-1]RDI95401.1 proline dehydrogenase [Meiothermus sp. QL-1]
MDLNHSYRAFVLAVAQNPRIEALVRSRARRLARRFVAGDTLEEALAAVEALEREGVHAILDLLGEMVRTEAEARRFQQELIRLVQALAARPYPRYLSLKLTQLGLDLGEELALELLEGVVREAERAGCFVRIDMEDSPRVEATLRIYRRLREAGHEGLGVVLQSYLKRSERDLEALVPLGTPVRIVKGAYREPPAVAFQDKRLVDAQFLLLAKKALEKGLPTAIATHDPRIIEEMKRWTAERGIERERFEFQMLYGVRPAEQKRLAQEGYTVRAYVPYGTDWYPYFSRRIAERPENLLFVARSLLPG